MVTAGSLYLRVGMKPTDGAKIIQSDHPLARLKAISGLKLFHHGLW
jgi:hypothetical protein